MELYLKYELQIKRIQKKLKQAKRVDLRCKVFGASTHKYHLGSPLSAEALAKFEKEFQVKLPEAFAAFLLFIGNGGKSKYGNAGAGPNYGIFPLKLGLENLTEDLVDCFNTVSPLHPKMSDNEWQLLASKVLDDDIAPIDYDKEKHKICAGLMCIGHQGCGLYQFLVVNGPFKGRIVNMDTDPISQPIFAHEDNFLDWYERWLDEIIDGRLIDDEYLTYGYLMGGNADSLLAFYDEAKDDFDKLNALEGFLILRSVNPKNCNKLIEIVEAETGVVRNRAIEALCKWQHISARPYLEALINGSDEDALIAFKAIYYHARDKASRWSELTQNRIKRIETYETLQIATYILNEAKVDYAKEIVAFCQHENIEMKVQAYYCLGKSPTKHEYIPDFIIGLRDTSQRVVHTCLQALKGVQDVRLIKPYYYSRKQFEQDEYYLEMNLEHRVKDMGFHSVVDFYKSYRNGTAEKRFNSPLNKIIRMTRRSEKS